MPAQYKALVSILVLIVAAALFWFDTRSGSGGAARWVVLALGPAMVAAIWMFPEPKSKATRREPRAR